MSLRDRHRFLMGVPGAYVESFSEETGRIWLTTARALPQRADAMHASVRSGDAAREHEGIELQVHLLALLTVAELASKLKPVDAAEVIVASLTHVLGACLFAGVLTPQEAERRIDKVRNALVDHASLAIGGGDIDGPKG